MICSRFQGHFTLEITPLFRAISYWTRLGGAAAIKSGYDRSADTQIHEDAIRELDDSFEAEVAPMVVEVEGHTVKLTGSAEQQYRSWRRLLREIYASETGFALMPVDNMEDGPSDAHLHQ